MEQETLTRDKLFIRDLCDGQDVDSVFLVRELSRREKKDGAVFLKLGLGDKSGGLEAVMWEGCEDALPACSPGSVVRAAGKYTLHERYGPTLTVRALRLAADGEFDMSDLVEISPIPYAQMTSDLETLIETVQRPYLRELLRRLLGADTKLGRRWREAPAAKHYHQAYRHGLLEHSLSVAQGVHLLAARFPGIDHDVAVTGALLHDIGKVRVYETTGGAIGLTDAGKLLGEIPLSYYIVRREMEEIPGFPPEAAQAVLHIVLSHHGKLEHGSPVLPCTREATLVHFMDNLGGNLGSFDRIEKTLAEGETWSNFDRGISSSAYFMPSQDAPSSASEAA